MSKLTKVEREHKLKLIEKTRNKIKLMTCESQPYIFDKEEKIINKIILELESDNFSEKLIRSAFEYISSAFQFIEDYNSNKVPDSVKNTLLEKIRNCKNQCKKYTRKLLDKFSKIKDNLPKQIKEFINEKITAVTDLIIGSSRVLRI